MTSAIATKSNTLQAAEEAETYTLNEIHEDDCLEADQLGQWFVHSHVRRKASVELQYACDGNGHRKILENNYLPKVSGYATFKLASEVIHIPIFART